MVTVVYFLRHSQYNRFNYYDVDDTFLIKNERQILTCKGEKLANKVSDNEELKNIDVVFSSHYVRALSTAKYVASKNNIDINVSDKLGERIHGNVNEDYEEFEKKQLLDFDYKVINGESLNDVKKRMSEYLKTILKIYEGKRICIVTHSACLIALFSAWCNKEYNCDEELMLSYQGNVIINGYSNDCDLYKVTFEDLNVRDIEYIEVD